MRKPSARRIAKYPRNRDIPPPKLVAQPVAVKPGRLARSRENILGAFVKFLEGKQQIVVRNPKRLRLFRGIGDALFRIFAEPLRLPIFKARLRHESGDDDMTFIYNGPVPALPFSLLLQHGERALRKTQVEHLGLNFFDIAAMHLVLRKAVKKEEGGFFPGLPEIAGQEQVDFRFV